MSREMQVFWTPALTRVTKFVFAVVKSSVDYSDTSVHVVLLCFYLPTSPLYLILVFSTKYICGAPVRKRPGSLTTYHAQFTELSTQDDSAP